MQDKQSAQLNCACLRPLALLCGPGSAAATEPPALLALSLDAKKRSAVFGTSVTEPRSLLSLYTLLTFSIFDFIPTNERTNERYNKKMPSTTINIYLYTTRPNPQSAPSIVQPLRALYPVTSNHHTTTTWNRPILSPSNPPQTKTRKSAPSSMSSPASLAGPDRACLPRKDLLQLLRGWMLLFAGSREELCDFAGFGALVCAFGSTDSAYSWDSTRQ